jgi:hypothetical protein
MISQADRSKVDTSVRVHSLGWLSQLARRRPPSGFGPASGPWLAIDHARCIAPSLAFASAAFIDPSVRRPTAAAGGGMIIGKGIDACIWSCRELLRPASVVRPVRSIHHLENHIYTGRAESACKPTLQHLMQITNAYIVHEQVAELPTCAIYICVVWTMVHGSVRPAGRPAIENTKPATCIFEAS